jgi:predicted DNA-binding transcriptional regulator YafY
MPPESAGNDKLQRWVDLVTALLTRRLPATFDEVATQVPAYARALQAHTNLDEAERKRRKETIKRTFERDKDELRAFGFPIETERDPSGNSDGRYTLKKQDFYLPYLALVAPGSGAAPLTRLPADAPAQANRARAGSMYSALALLAFEPDELQAVVDAAACARELGDPTLALEATRALRKLAFDLPVRDGDANAAPTARHDAAQHDTAIFQQLAGAVQRRKRVTIRYHAMGRDEERERTIDPWGLFFLSGHWYCVARDHEVDALRNFRLNRVRRVAVNSSKPQTADFVVPPTFRLRDHAASRQAWELGDETPLEIIVQFRATGGAHDAHTLGDPLPPTANGLTRRRFAVRRTEPFVRWLLAAAGDAIPEAPPGIVAQLQAALDRLDTSLETADARARELGDALRAPTAPPPRPPARPTRLTETALHQLRRLLEVLPHLAGGDDIPIDDLLARTGLPFETLRDDVYALITRYDDPAGFVEGVQLYFTAEHMSAVSEAFRRPMRLVATEVCAIALGLSVLAHLRPPDERAVIERARTRLRGVMASIGNDPLLEGIAATLHEGGTLATLHTVRAALTAREVLRMTYRKPDALTAEPREIEPYALVASGARLYVVAHCRRAHALRLFRVDRIQTAEPTGEQFTLPGDFSLDQVLARGKAFLQGAHDLLVVRYAPAIARWIAEREGVECDADGSVTLSHPLADPMWAMRHVAQYAGDAELLAPASLRTQLRERLAQLREALTTIG